MAGWVKLHRDITDNFLWSGEPFSKGQAWVDLILHANFTDNKIQIKGQVIHVKRGQQARSVLTLVKEWKWSKGKVLRFLETLKNERMIEVKTGHLTSIITICNYEGFQGGDTPDGTPNSTAGDTPDGTLAVHQAVHSKEGKKEIREEGEEIDMFEKPSASPIPYQKIVDLYHEHCTDLPAIQKLSPARQARIKTFWNNDIKHKDLDFIARYLKYVSVSDFLNGKIIDNNRSKPWRADIEWLFNLNNFAKVIEGQYHGDN